MIEVNSITCGNCLSVIKQIEDNSIDGIITDPPYSLGYDFEGDNLSLVDQSEFMKKYLFEFKRVLKEGRYIVIFLSQELTHYLYFNALNLGFTWQNEIIWHKYRGHTISKKFGICHEVISVYSKGPPSIFNLDSVRVKSKYAESDNRLNPKGKNPGDVWYVPALFGKKLERISVNGKAAHPTQKPIKLIEPLVLAYTNPGDIILDPFCGSGTTLVCSKAFDRNYIGIDISQSYCKIAEKRTNVSISQELY